MSIKAILIAVSLFFSIEASANFLKNIFSDSENTEKISMVEEDKKVVEKKWDDLFKKIEKAENTRSKIDDAPESALFGDSKVSLRKDLDEQLSEILFMVTEDKAALKFISNIRKFKKEIELENDNITMFREALVFPKSEKETKTLVDKINKSEKIIEAYETKIQKSKESLLYNLSTAGVHFTSEQIDALITRVDVDDILQLTLVYNQLKIITEQLSKIMEVTQKDIKATKKYYAMYVILSEMIVYTQKQYLNKMQNNYIPRITKIVIDTEKIQKSTKLLLTSTNDVNHKKVLKSNYDSQKLSAKTASLYKKQLVSQAEKIKKSLKKSTNDLKIALNTFKTVQISYTLLDIIKESRESFNTLMNLQLPELVPFENKEMAEEFGKITKELSN